MSEQKPHIIGYSTLIGVWACLLALTAVTVAISRYDLGTLNIWCALGIASVKSALVIAFFMHMKYEGRLLRLSLLTALVVLTIFIGLTLSDVLYR